MRSVESEIGAVIRGLKSVWGVALAFSFFVNLSLIVPSVYMLQVYDRVITSRSEMTLLMLTAIALFMYGLMGALEWLRGRLLVRASTGLDTTLNERVFAATFTQALRDRSANANQVFGDLAVLRQFVGGAGIMVWFDVPFLPIFLGVIFLLHPHLGVLALAGSMLSVGLTVLTERTTERPLTGAIEASGKSVAYAANTLRHAEVIQAMGMLPQLYARWVDKQLAFLGLYELASERAGRIQALAKFVRVGQQTVILGAGAIYAISGDLSPGGMVVASILVGRVMGPMEMAIQSWKGLVQARDSYQRLSKLLQENPAPMQRMVLPPPEGSIRLEGVTAAPPGSEHPVIRGMSFSMNAGDSMAVIGPSAAGKSSLARLLVGVWNPVQGKVRLDGADIAMWNRAELGKHLGYLPQEVELFEGTAAENIARFSEVDSQKVITAARHAGVHEMVLRLPQGYETPVGDGGCYLSAGQRQRIGLARALYGDPGLVVLDEPNSNLDDAGERALAEAVAALKARGATVVLVTHRPAIIQSVDKVMLVVDGQVHVYGPRVEALKVIAKMGHLPSGVLVDVAVAA